MTGKTQSGSCPPSKSDSDDADRLKTKNYCGYTRRQLTTVEVFGFANIFANIIISLQAPFYPKEAEAKGATATEYGFVLGVFQLVVCIMCPVYGSIIGIVNPRLLFNLGIFTVGTCACLFGFLDYIDDHLAFIALSFTLRIIQACGDAAYFTASFMIIALEFPNSVATTFATLETCSGVGLILGPSIGGVLYEIGGFLLPFLSIGVIFFLTAFVTYFILPDITYSKEREELGQNKVPSGIISLLKSPAVALAIFSVIISASSIGFLVATLEPHLRANFGLTPLYTGLVFIIDASVYALSAPLFGMLCDKCNQPKIITLIGCTLTFIGFLFIGPAPFLPFKTILWVTCVGLVIHGLGVAASLVAAFAQALQDAINSGFPDCVATYGLVSGVWASSFAMGSFIGPSVGGSLLDHFGFRLSTIFVLATQVLIALLVVLLLCFSKDSKSKKSTDSDSENQSLLRGEKGIASVRGSYDSLAER